MNTQFKKGALELCVLSKLAGSDRYGYDLTEEISSDMTIATGTLYLILKRLKDEEHVSTYLRESENGPARKYYYLTDSGRQYQEELKAEWKSFVSAVNNIIGD